MTHQPRDLDATVHRLTDRVTSAIGKGSELEEEEGGLALVVEVADGVRIVLHAESPEALSLACQMADKHGIPYTTIQ